LLLRTAFLKLLSWALKRRVLRTASSFSALSTGFLAASDELSDVEPSGAGDPNCWLERIQLASLDTSGRPPERSIMDASSQRRISLSLTTEQSESRALLTEGLLLLDLVVSEEEEDEEEEEEMLASHELDLWKDPSCLVDEQTEEDAEETEEAEDAVDGEDLASSRQPRRLCVNSRFSATLRCSRSDTCERKRRHSPCKFFWDMRACTT